ncbi:hypothetical protein HMPREF0208_04943 [Citrobacter koseri]|nr:hypothetical protein HMPREF0208_04943 [Citrobacter koseri]
MGGVYHTIWQYPLIARSPGEGLKRGKQRGEWDNRIVCGCAVSASCYHQGRPVTSP